MLADLDENMIRRSLPFGLDTSIGAVETHASENLILRESEICDYSDRLLVRHQRRHRHAPKHIVSDAAEDPFLQTRMSVTAHHQ